MSKQIKSLATITQELEESDDARCTSYHRFEPNKTQVEVETAFSETSQNYRTVIHWPNGSKLVALAGGASVAAGQHRATCAVLLDNDWPASLSNGI